MPSRLGGVVFGLSDRLGDYIRAARRRARLSQRQLAQTSGVNKNTIARLEGDTHFDPRLSTVERLARAAGWLVVFADHDGRIIAPYESDVTLDDARRELPAHLEISKREPAYLPSHREGGYTFRRAPKPEAGP